MPVLAGRLVLPCFMLAAIKIGFERGKPMRLFDHVILLTVEIMVDAKKSKPVAEF